MTTLKFSMFNVDFIKNMPSELLSELITLNDAIPSNLRVCVGNHNTLFDKERRKFIRGLTRNNPIMIAMAKERGKSRKMDVNTLINYSTELDLEFIEKYPQFREIIKGIEYCDEYLNTIKVEHFPWAPESQ